MKIFVYVRAKLVLEPLLQPTEKVETMLVISVFGDTHIYVYIYIYIRRQLRAPVVEETIKSAVSRANV